MKNYGATIERGTICAVTDDGYKVQSLTRDGITTPALPSLCGDSLKTGDRVYYFMFDDGHGAIMAAFE